MNPKIKGPIFIVGISRSGTSMTCGLLSSLGLDFGGGLKLGDEWNPGGYWESLKGRKAFKEAWRMLEKEMGKEGRDVDFSYLGSPKVLRKIKKKLKPHWAQADAMKVPAIWTVWGSFKEIYPEAKWVLTQRAVSDILASWKRVPFTKAKGEWREEIEYRLSLLEDLHKSSCDTMELWPDPSQPEVFRPVVEWIGLEWDEEKVRSWLKPSLWRSGGE